MPAPGPAENGTAGGDLGIVMMKRGKYSMASCSLQSGDGHGRGPAPGVARCILRIAALAAVMAMLLATLAGCTSQSRVSSGSGATTNSSTENSFAEYAQEQGLSVEKDSSECEDALTGIVGSYDKLFTCALATKDDMYVFLFVIDTSGNGSSGGSSGIDDRTELADAINDALKSNAQSSSATDNGYELSSDTEWAGIYGVDDSVLLVDTALDNASNGRDFAQGFLDKQQAAAKRVLMTIIVVTVVVLALIALAIVVLLHNSQKKTAPQAMYPQAPQPMPQQAQPVQQQPAQPQERQPQQQERARQQARQQQ